jgi:hypothetical protein
MHIATKAALAGVAIVALLVASAGLRHPAPSAAGAGSAQGPALTPEQRGGTMSFAAVNPQDQQVIRDAIASARPEAQRLIDMVDGAVTVRVIDTGADAAGWTAPNADGYEVAFDLAKVSQVLGQRGIARTVLHELGHVVDFALVPDDVSARLDVEIPQGYGPCRPGQRDASCTARAERFAETFAKWANGDIGAGLDIGYRVPPPSVSLEEWGGPLAQLQG